MNRRQRHRRTLLPNNGLGGMLALSLALHLVLFFLASKIDLFRDKLHVEQAIYVDMVNLPVASPQAGSPSGPVAGPSAPAQPAATAPSPPPPAPKAMKVPAAKQTPTKTSPVKSAKAPAGKSSQEYEARLAAMERNADARRQESAIAEIQNRIASGKTGAAPAGMPGATGNQSGSDYSAYLQSRLRESFAATIAWQTKKPMVAVKLTVDARGGLLSYKIEKSTGDVVFEDAVYRAVQLAKKNFPPPPGGKEFSYGFVFKPEGVDKR